MSLGSSYVNVCNQFAFDLNKKPVDDGNWDSPKKPDSPDKSDLCSICFEPLTSDDHRAIVTLKCGHKFHLDCIGSAFNAKSKMQCPNCKQIEPGEWRFAASSPISAFGSEELGAEEENNEAMQREFPFVGSGSQAWVTLDVLQHRSFNNVVEANHFSDMERQMNLMIYGREDNDSSGDDSDSSDDDSDSSGDGGSDINMDFAMDNIMEARSISELELQLEREREMNFMIYGGNNNDSSGDDSDTSGEGGSESSGDGGSDINMDNAMDNVVEADPFSNQELHLEMETEMNFIINDDDSESSDDDSESSGDGGSDSSGDGGSDINMDKAME